MPYQSLTDVLCERVSVADLDVLDVGCGEGDLVRWLWANDARATGVDCGEEMLARALAADPDHHERYVDAGAEDLPFADAVFDLVVFAYSLHHVPIRLIPHALREARRVLRPTGTVYAVEPGTDDPDSSIGGQVSDERVELAEAQRWLARAAELGFAEQARVHYVSEDVYRDFDAWVDALVSVDPARTRLLDEQRDTVAERFYARTNPHPEGYAVERMNHLVMLTAV